MKLDFNKSPLSIYNKPACQALLCAINSNVANNINHQQFVLNMVVNKLFGGAFLIGNLTKWCGERVACKCLSNLISEQTNIIKYNPSTLLEVAQVNLMYTSCVTGYLDHLKYNGSTGNCVIALGKVGAAALLRRFGFYGLHNKLLKSNEADVNEYAIVCQVYHIAFLLTIYNSIPPCHDVAESLITESLSGDYEGESSLFAQKRPVLFSNIRWKSLEDNLINRLGALPARSGLSKDLYNELYDPFIKWRIKYNTEQGQGVD